MEVASVLKLLSHYLGEGNQLHFVSVDGLCEGSLTRAAQISIELMKTLASEGGQGQASATAVHPENLSIQARIIAACSARLRAICEPPAVGGTSSSEVTEEETKTMQVIGQVNIF